MPYVCYYLSFNYRNYLASSILFKVAMFSRGMKMVQKEIKAAKVTPLRPAEETEMKEIKQYTNLVPVEDYVENAADRKDALVNDDISSISAAASASLQLYVSDSDDSVKDPDYHLPDSKVAERFESEESDISDSDNLSIPVTTSSKTTASIGAMIPTKVAASHELMYTQKGEVRKRKIFGKSRQERKDDSIIKQREKHYVRPGCNSCSRKCNEFTKDHRISLNSQYWLMNWQERRVFISSNVSVHGVKRRRGSDNSDRNRTFKYFLKQDRKSVV